MSTDDRHDDKPEFPLGDEAAASSEDAATPASPDAPPLPAIPAWEAPATGHTEPVHAEELPPVGSPVPAAAELPSMAQTPALADDAAPLAAEPVTRAPLGGPYVVNETGAPVATQAAAAYEREPQGGPYVTASEPVPYPAAAFAPAAGAAVVAGPGPAGAPGAYPGAPGSPAPYPGAQAVPVLAGPPQPPAPKGNRGGGALIALIGTVVFAVVYAAVSFVVILANATVQNAFTTTLSYLATAAFIVPAVVFAIALILIVLIVNRAGWWAYVLGGFFVAVLVYFGGIAGALIHVQAWNWQPQEQYEFVRSLAMDPLTLAGAIVAREVSIWTGAWIARRGRAVKARNVAARVEFDRTQADAAAAASAPYGEAAAPGTTW